MRDRFKKSWSRFINVAPKNPTQTMMSRFMHNPEVAPRTIYHKTLEKFSGDDFRKAFEDGGGYV